MKGAPALHWDLGGVARGSTFTPLSQNFNFVNQGLLLKSV